MREYLRKEEALKLSKEVARLVLDKNLTIREAERIVLEKYKKAHSLTDQSIENEHSKTNNDIIPLGVDIDNGKLYFEKNGQTFKDL